jgi:hypothetical protein
LQHVATAAAINLLRAVNWLRGVPKLKHAFLLLPRSLLDSEFADSIQISKTYNGTAYRQRWKV